MNNRSVYVVSLGCPKNLVDTEYLLGEFERLGYTPAAEPEEAEVIMVNTCAFILPAVEEAVDVILDMIEYKLRGSCGTLIVAGCLPQRYGGDLQEELPEVDIFLGPGELARLEEFLRRGERDIREIPGFGLPHPPDAARGLTRKPATPFYMSYLKIAEGCDNRCTFCTIPPIRAPFRSRDPRELVEEARELAARGVVELNLVAQDSTCYGLDLEEKVDLAALLEQLAHVEGLRWIRPLYLYPERVDERLIRAIAAHPVIVPYFDLPFQHVSPRVRKRMGRPLRKTDPLALVERIRSIIPQAALRSTLMVGFPGETEEDFALLLDFVRRARLDHLGVFSYCREEGTTAARMREQVAEAVKEERRGEVMTVQADISRSRNRERVGSVIEVLVEGFSEETDLLLQGRASFQAPEIDGVVYIGSGRAEVGSIVPVRVVEAGDYDLAGEMV